MSFEDKVKATGEISGCYEAGLQALDGNNSKSILVNETRDLDGSVNLDNCTLRKYQNANRWDYIIGYKNEAFFVEVHPASSGEVKEIVKKVKWLKKWLKTKASQINSIKAKQQPFRWVASGKIAITKNSRYSRTLTQNNVSFPQKVTKLD